MTHPAYRARDGYRGDIAESYLRCRTGQRKWGIEQEVFAKLIEELPPASSILDVPVGTGRFLDDYRRGGHAAVGLDISPDMLSQIRRRSDDRLALVLGDAEHLPFGDASIDNVLSARFLNLVPPSVLHRAVAQMGRVARRRLLLEVRVAADETLGRRLWGGLREFLAHPISATARLSRTLRASTGDSASGYFIHAEREVRRAFAAAGLGIARVVYLAEGSAHTRRFLRFTPLRVYVLEKQSHPRPCASGPASEGHG